MKKRHLLSGIVCASLLLTSCASVDYDSIAGYEEIMAAKRNYEALDSGHMVEYDNITGEKLLDFYFRYEGETCTYYYRATDGETVFYEHNNGYRQSYAYSTDQAWTELSGEDENFNTYTRKMKPSYATGAAIFYVPESIKESSEEKLADNITKYSAEYDIELLKRYANSQLEAVGGLSALSIEYFIDGEGNMSKFVLKGTSADGAKQINATTTIDMMNSVEPLERPELSALIAEEKENENATAEIS